MYSLVLLFCVTDVDNAFESFSKLQKVDPYRLENMDTYSNLLYVKVCTMCRGTQLLKNYKLISVMTKKNCVTGDEGRPGTLGSPLL